MVANRSYVSVEEYLAGERRSQIKHEYIDGRVYAMAGASDAHVTIAGNVFALLKNHLRGGPCRAYISDMKLQINDLGRYFYPDVMATCDERDHMSREMKKYPSLVVEVVSPTTEAFDRGRKFGYYRHLSSLQEYVLIDPARQSVECLRPGLDGAWILQPYGDGDTVTFSSVGLSCPIGLLYEDVRLEDAADVEPAPGAP